MTLILIKISISTIFLMSKVFSDCSDLDYSDCLYWSSDCEWNEDTETCQYIGGGNDLEYGPYEFTSISESDGMRDGPLYLNTELYFPLNYPGILKSIVLGAGHGDSGESMYYWASLLASHGFVAATIDYNDPINESHYQRGLALLDLIETVKQENSRFSSPIFGLMDTSKFALVGSSMSGGAIIEAAMSDSLEILDALISLNPTVIFEDCDLCAGSEYCICLVPEFLEEQDVPIMIISGENETDDIGYEGMLGIDIYLNHPDMTTKLLYEILDGGHSSAIPHVEPVRKKVISWLNYYLNNDTTECSQLLEEPGNISQFLTNFECAEGQLGFEENFMPLDFALHQNYPNPFNPTTNLSYELLADSYVTITVYDLLGNMLRNLVSEYQSSGLKSVQWDATNEQGQSVAAGVYLYRIESGSFTNTKKMILLK